MIKRLLIAMALVFTYPAFAQDAQKGEHNLTIQQIERTEQEGEKLNAIGKVVEGITSDQRELNNITFVRVNSCLKAFGHERFRNCLKENLAIAISFQDYVVAVTNTKEELKYAAMPAEKKQIFDNAVTVREKCVSTITGG